jgi:hypothetical protein
MDELDPHIHVESRMNADGMVRNLLASSFGLVGDLPSVVTTGCELRVPRAMTSTRPESVTCLACREHAHHQYLRFAEQVEQLSAMPGVEISGDQARRAAAEYRDLATRYADPDR